MLIKVLLTHERKKSLEAILRTYLSFWQHSAKPNLLIIADSSLTPSLTEDNILITQLKGLLNLKLFILPGCTLVEKEIRVYNFLVALQLSVDSNDTFISLCTDQDLHLETNELKSYGHKEFAGLYAAPFLGWCTYPRKVQTLEEFQNKILLRPMLKRESVKCAGSVKSILNACRYPNTNLFWSIQSMPVYQARIYLLAAAARLLNKQEMKFSEVLLCVFYSFMVTNIQPNSFGLRSMDFSNTLRKTDPANKGMLSVSFSSIYETLMRESGQPRYSKLLYDIKKAILNVHSVAPKYLLPDTLRCINLGNLDRLMKLAVGSYYRCLAYDLYQERYLMELAHDAKCFSPDYPIDFTIENIIEDQSHGLSRFSNGQNSNYYFELAPPLTIPHSISQSQLKMIIPNSVLCESKNLENIRSVPYGYWHYCQ